MVNKNLKVGSRVTISTHGSNLGTVKDLNPKEYPSDTVVVHMDGESGPRLCMKENVLLITTIDCLFCKGEFICNNPELLKQADQHRWWVWQILSTRLRNQLFV